MDNYFEQELNYIEHELTSLKTSMILAASEINFTSHSITFSIRLELNSTQSIARGRANFRVVSSSNNILTFATLNKYYDNVSQAASFNSRYFRLIEGITNSGSPCVSISANGTDNDVNTLINGGSVILSGTLTVWATDSFRLEEV